MKLKLPAPGVLAAVTLLFLVVAVAFSIWWPYHREQAVLQSLGATGEVEVEYEFHGPAMLDSYADSEWLNWFRRVRRLDIEQAGAVEPSTPALAPLLHCDTVALHYCLIDRRMAARVAECPRLASLELRSCEIEVGALRGLDRHGHLSDIQMAYSECADSILELPSAPALVSFRGNFNRSLRALDVSAAPQLRRVELKNCGVDDAGVERLLDAPRITVLMLPNTRITDAAIDDLLQLESLRFLDLRLNHRMTRPAIERLADLPKLRTVAVWYVISDGEFNELHEVLPQATLDHRP